MRAGRASIALSSVFGTTEADSDAGTALFGDLLGLSMALQYPHSNVSGTFLNCFLLDEHLEILGYYTLKQRPLRTSNLVQTETEKHYSPTVGTNTSLRNIHGTLIAAVSN